MIRVSFVGVLLLLAACAATEQTTQSTSPAPTDTGEARETAIGVLYVGQVTKKNFGTHAAQAMISDGWKQVQASRFDVALDPFSGSTILGRERGAGYWGHGAASHGVEYTDALLNGCFARAETLLSPAPAGLYSDWGRVLDERRNSADALAKFERALSLDPDHLEAQTGAARSNLALGNEAAAASHIAATQHFKGVR